MIGTHSKTTRKPAWALGATLLGLHKILENMEIGHNVMHGQWDWMNDPEIHSSNWEWDTAQPAEQWKHSHNYIHHQFTNVLGHDNDIGYGILRMAREQRGTRYYLGPAGLQRAAGVALPVGRGPARPRPRADPQGREGPQGDEAAAAPDRRRKGRNQILKDYVVYPALSGRQWKSTMTGQRHRQPGPQPVVLHDHLLRPLPRRRDALHRGGARGRDPAGVVPAPDAGLGQLRGRPAPAHPQRAASATRSSTTSSRTCRATATRRSRSRCGALCDKYDMPYTTGPLYRQYGQALRTIMKLSLPNHMTSSDDPAPPERRDTASEPARDRRRKSDEERQPRRRELGGWSRSPRERSHD